MKRVSYKAAVNGATVTVLLVAFCAAFLSAGLTAAQQRRGAQAAGDPESDPEAAAARRFRGVSSEVQFDGKSVSVTTGTTPVDGPDFAQLADPQPGMILQQTQSTAAKLKTSVNLVFGETVINTENVAKNYPGVYSLWLKKTDSGWSLIFNEKADVWGTQHDPKADVAEVPLTYAKLDEPSKALKFELVKEGGGGMLHITFGPHRWSAPFTVQAGS